MDALSWGRLKELHELALSVPASEREAWLSARAGEERELIAELRRLLAIDDAARGSFVEPPEELAEWPDHRGAVFGEFELGEVLGTGGHGVVYRGRRRGDRTDVAVKVLANAGPRRVQRFRREVLAAARIEHDNVARVLGFGDHDGLPWYAMELVDGVSLAALLAARAAGRPSPLPGVDIDDWRTVSRIVEGVLRGLAAAHRQGLVHRDVKPANVLVTPGGVPKLVDFGLARDRLLDDLTRSGELSGTPHYMSPEQAAARSDAVDHRSDLFSVGAVLYELLARRRPFEADGALELMRRIVDDAPPPLGRVAAEVPRPLARICMQALRKAPARRYRDAAGMADDLRAHREGRPVAARRYTPWAELGARLRRDPSRLAAAGGVVVLLGLAAVLMAPVFASAVEADLRWRWLGPPPVPPVEVRAWRAGPQPCTWTEVPVAWNETGPLGLPVDTLRLLVAAGGRRGEWVGTAEAGVPVDVEMALRDRAERNGIPVRGGTVDVAPIDSRGVQHELRVDVPDFRIAPRCVTNAEFREFARATGRTELLDSAYWRRGSHTPGFDGWPVTGVLYEDAQAYAAWAGGRLPSQAEALLARGGAKPGWLTSGADLSGAILGRGKLGHLVGNDPYFEHVGPAAGTPIPTAPYPLEHPVGNVWELTTTPKLTPSRKPGRWVQAGGTRMAVGGAWYHRPKSLRATGVPTTYYVGSIGVVDIGMRLVFTP